MFSYIFCFVEMLNDHILLYMTKNFKIVKYVVMRYAY